MSDFDFDKMFALTPFRKLSMPYHDQRRMPSCFSECRTEFYVSSQDDQVKLQGNQDHIGDLIETIDRKLSEKFYGSGIFDSLSRVQLLIDREVLRDILEGAYEV